MGSQNEAHHQSSLKHLPMKLGLSTFTLAVSAVGATLSMPAPRTIGASAPSIEDGVSALRSILQMKELEKLNEFEQLLDLLKTQLAENNEDSGRLSSSARHKSSLPPRVCRCSNLARGIQPAFCRNFHCIPN